jgi:hypothetical protein
VLAKVSLLSPTSVAKPLAKVLAKMKSMSPRSVAKPVTKVLRGDVVDEAEGDGKPLG